MSTLLRRVFANPRVTPGVVIALLLLAMVAVPRALDAVEQRQAFRELERARTWTADPWTFTPVDFPGRRAATIPVEPRWMVQDYETGWRLGPERATGLAPLFHLYLARPMSYWFPDETSGVSGVRVDDVEVYSWVVTPRGPGFDTGDGSSHAWRLQGDASRIAEYQLPAPRRWAEERDAELMSVGYVGAPTEPAWWTSHLGEPFEPGGPGYFGVTVDERTSDGTSSRTTTLATRVDGSLALVGVVVPEGVTPSDDLEPALLLERLFQGLRAHPPVAPGATDGSQEVTRDVAQADSRTTREVGRVIAAGS
ncbi:hypothetical protein ACQP60_16040 [Isoptericola variabilis]|uniref:hypothetical protein n=1 Tax=Isoptericola variabilis TaxID=139208 RepID=UPI003D235333